MRRRSRRAPRPIEIEPSDSFAELTIHLGLCPSDNIRPGHEHDVEAGSGRRCHPAEALPQETPGPVAHHGSSEFSPRRYAQSVLRLSVLKGDEHELASREAPAFPKHPVELRACAQPASTLQLQAHALVKRDTSDRQPLAPLLAPTLQDQATALGPHPDQEAVGALPLPVVGLERPLHADPLNPGGPDAGSRLGDSDWAAGRND
jgi:hypothetical protein